MKTFTCDSCTTTTRTLRSAVAHIEAAPQHEMTSGDGDVTVTVSLSNDSAYEDDGDDFDGGRDL